jgi:hypothetical protein
MLYDVVLETKRGYGCAKVEALPPEEFGVNKNARRIEDATYCYHGPTGVTESDLIAQGYDKIKSRTSQASTAKRARKRRPATRARPRHRPTTSRRPTSL